MTDDDLIAAARDAAAKSYSPYSGFPVGAALRFADGSVVTGTNIENAQRRVRLHKCRHPLLQVALQYGKADGALGAVIDALGKACAEVVEIAISHAQTLPCRHKKSQLVAGFLAGRNAYFW